VPGYFLGVESLAMAWESLGNQPRALRVLERAYLNDERAYGWSCFYWEQVALRLAERYRKLGRDGDASEIENRLRVLLQGADSDSTIARHLANTALY
jgi:hypothetical protein